jgi:glycosyltransferase involved in cell wall biosynthesis
MFFNFSIIIPTYNRVQLLAPTLESVFQIRVPRTSSVELLVIDNNCSDGTADVIAQKAANAPFSCRHLIEPRQGLCFGRNRGVNEARYEHLVYLDDDIEVNADWLFGYIEAVERLEADCVCGPVYPKYLGGVPKYCTERIIQSVDSSYSRKGDDILILPSHLSHQVPGCNFGVRKTVTERIGGFNTSLDRVGRALLAGGDTEFAMRLTAAGKRVVYHPACSITHVLTPDKVSRKGLRRRWTGLGATRRALTSNTTDLSLRRKTRYLRDIARSLAASAVYRIRGQAGLAFQRELEARRNWAFLTHRRPKI